MLVLTRRLNESIIINGDIRVTIVSVQGDKVRIGIAAPDSVRVDREEVHQRRTDFTTDLLSDRSPSSEREVIAH